MPRYSFERKEAVLRKLLPPISRPVTHVSIEEGISEQTLHNWLKQLRSEEVPVPHSGQAPDGWSARSQVCSGC